MLEKIKIPKPGWIIGLLILAVFSLTGVLEAAVLSVRGNRFYLDEQPFWMWGTRVANALKDDQHTEELIANLDDYYRYGVNTVSVFIQGAYGGRDEHAGFDGFFPDGQLRPEAVQRLSRIIEECDKRKMAVCVGYFYQRKDQNLRDEEAVINAVRTASKWLKEKNYRNVFVDIVNEFGHRGFDHPILIDPDRRPELISALKKENPRLLCGISDVGVPLDLPGQADIQIFHGPFKEIKSVNKPIVNNEPIPLTVNDDFDRRGIYSKADMDEYKKEAWLHARNGYYWFQYSAFKQEIPCHFEIGPENTQPGGEPSDHWIFEHIRHIRSKMEEPEGLVR